MTHLCTSEQQNYIGRGQLIRIGPATNTESKLFVSKKSWCHEKMNPVYYDDFRIENLELNCVSMNYLN